jgi:translation initiation factor 5B
LDRKVYDLVLKLSEMGLNSERFDRIRDFTKTIAIVPVSGRTGEGLPELLASSAGLTPHFMKDKIKFAEDPAKGVVMEVKEETGLGTTIDVIVYEGVLKKNDIVVVAGLNGPIITKVSGILVLRE